MIKPQLSTQQLAMLACVVLGAALAGCDHHDRKSSDTYVPPPTVSPTAQFIGDVGSTIGTTDADTMEPAAVDPAPAPTSETEEPAPVT